jgi:hydrogenase/urease accessory protein HupE
MHGRKGFQSAAKFGSTVTAMLLFPLLAEAHPGPGPHELVDGTVHLLTSPDHLAELVAFAACGVVVAVITAVVLIRRRRG